VHILAFVWLLVKAAVLLAIDIANEFGANKKLALFRAARNYLERRWAMLRHILHKYKGMKNDRV
jgi:hypothetical protein